MQHIQCDDRFTVIIDKVYTFDSGHPNHLLLQRAVADGDSTLFLDNISIPSNITKWSEGEFVYDGSLTYKGFEISSVIADIILDAIKNKKDYKPLLNFLEKLYQNPSHHAVQGLYDWMQHRSMEIAPDGNMLTYKYVIRYFGDEYTDKLGRAVKDGDFVDRHSRTYRNNVGDTNTMPRFMVNDNRDLGCESGFHVGTISYVRGQSHIMICSVNPKDVVSIPHDCNCQKIRCCEYTVVSEYRELDHA